MPKIHVVVENHSQSNMLNQYRLHAGQFAVSFFEMKFSGDDVFSFFQNQSTFDIKLITCNKFQLINFLDPQGRVECFGWLINSNEHISLLVPKALLEQTIFRLNKFLISEDVMISDPIEKEFHFLIGPIAIEFAETVSFTGILFDEAAYLQNTANDQLPIISEAEVELWRGLSGWPKFDGTDYRHEIINNLRLFDLGLSLNKGCYPGQETVSKIATRRGAALGPVLIEMDTPAPSGEILSFEKKIGKSYDYYSWGGKYYLACDLLRDFRVEKMKIYFTLLDREYDGIVRYYPLISGDAAIKAQELFYEGSDHFKQDELALAEEKFRRAIKIDPTFADAYESLGVMLGRLSRYEEAITLMEQLGSVDTKSVLAHTNMSLFLMKLGKIEAAEEQKSLATIKSFQTFGDEAQNKEIQDKIREKQKLEWAQRESMFFEVLEIDPDDTLANYGIGSIAVEKGEWQIARNHLEKVLKQDAKYSVAYLALGKALKGLGLMEEAKNIWKEGIKISAAKGDLMPANQMQQELNF